LCPPNHLPPLPRKRSHFLRSFVDRLRIKLNSLVVDGCQSLTRVCQLQFACPFGHRALSTLSTEIRLSVHANLLCTDSTPPLNAKNHPCPHLPPSQARTGLWPLHRSATCLRPTFSAGTGSRLTGLGERGIFSDLVPHNNHRPSPFLSLLRLFARLMLTWSVAFAPIRCCMHVVVGVIVVSCVPSAPERILPNFTPQR
jgi:hypothetical protein